MKTNKVVFDFDEGDGYLFLLSPEPKESVLIKTPSGWCEAWFDPDVEWTQDSPDGPAEVDSGFVWVCLDDQFILMWDEVTEWLPLPEKMS